MPNATLGIICPSLTCATSFYRAIGPLAALRRTYSPDTLNLYPMHAVNWAHLRLIDYAFMQRPYNNDHLIAAKMIKAQRIPLWVDYDDFLLGIPEDNPCYPIYSPPDIQNNIEKLLSLADVVSVSTKHLAELYSVFSEKVIVVRNSLDDALLPLRKVDDQPQNKLILWRGSKTHKNDLETMREAAVKIASARPDWNWLFFGSDPWYTNLMPKKNTIVINETVDTIEYHSMIAEMRPALMVIPLVNSHFNQAKSDCSFLEGTYAGAAVIAPDFQSEFDSETCLKYPTGDMPTAPNAGILTTIEQALDSELPQLLAHNKKAWQYIGRHRLLSQANITRGKILDHLKELRNAR